MDTIDRARSYGVRMDESLDSAQIAEMHAVKREETVSLSDKRLARITRLRLIGYNSREYPRWDISYCYGELKDGTPVRVQLYGNIGRNWKGDLIKIAQAAGVFAKGLGLLDEDIVSRLYG
jgi:hypothetical protein